MNQWSDTQRQWKAFPLHWDLYSEYNNETNEGKLLTPFQVGILLAAVKPYRWSTRWIGLGITEDELEAQISEIEDRLMRNEATGMPEPIDTYEAIKMGIYDAFNDLAKQVVSGRVTDIVVGSDGTVTDPTTGGGSDGLPEDDPDTPEIDESFAASAGGAKTVTDGLQEILTNMFNWYAAIATVPQAAASTRLQLLYGFPVADADDFAAYWYTVYMNSQGTVTLTQVVLDGFFFCKGVSKQTLSEYVYEQHPVSLEIPVLEQFVQFVPLEQMQSWYERGTLVPSTDYVLYSCTKIGTEQFTLNFALAESFTFPFAGILKGGHRYKITASGSFADADVPNVVQDFFWKHDTSTGVKTFTGFTLSVSGTTNAVASQVPFQASHNYAWIFEKTGDDGGSFTKTNDVFTNPNVVGTITVTLEDLGEFAL